MREAMVKELLTMAREEMERDIKVSTELVEENSFYNWNAVHRDKFAAKSVWYFAKMAYLNMDMENDYSEMSQALDEEWAGYEERWDALLDRVSKN